MASENREDYLRAIFLLSVDKNRAIKTKELADMLSLSSASVSEMIKKLEAEELVDNEPYHGFSLTKAGIAEAFRILRRHRLLERFLVDTLNFPPGDVHEEAHRLEHAVSDEAADRIAELLRNPEHCPHESRIPGGGERILTMDEMRPGSSGRVIFSRLKGGHALDRLSSMGLVPDSEIRLVRRIARGPLIIMLKGSEIALDRSLASQFYIEA